MFNNFKIILFYTLTKVKRRITQTRALCDEVIFLRKTIGNFWEIKFPRVWDSKSLESCVTFYINVSRKKKSDNKGILEYFLPTWKGIQTTRQIYISTHAPEKCKQSLAPSSGGPNNSYFWRGKKRKRTTGNILFLSVYKQTLERNWNLITRKDCSHGQFQKRS